MAAAVWRANSRFLSRHPWQIFLAILGVALGVAVVVAVGLANTSAIRAFRLASQAIAGSATDQIVGGPAGLTDRLYTRLRVKAGIEASSPIVDGYARAADETLHIVGIDPFAGSASADSLGGVRAGAIRRLLIEPGALLLGSATARRLGLKPGNRMVIRCAGQRHTVTLAGLLPHTGMSAAQDGLAITDISTAQILTGQIGRLSRIDLEVPRGIAGRRMRARIAELLPAGARLMPSQARTGAMIHMTRAFRTNLTAMSLLALIVGMFLIYNTMTFAVLQRRRLIGMLRALGVTRREVFGQVVAEALVLGAIGTVAGIGLGIGLGEILLHLVTRTINNLYFVVSVTRLLVTPVPIMEGASLGVGATVLASIVPALEASGTTPGNAMRRSTIEQRTRSLSPRLALAGGILAVAALALLALPTRNLIVGFAVLFMVAVGMVLIAPIAVSWLSAIAHTMAARAGSMAGSVLGRFALRGITASLSRTGVAIAALMLALATTVGVGIMIQSLRATVRQWLSSTLQADVYVTVPQLDPSGTPPEIDPRVVTAIRQIPGIAAVTGARRATVESSGGLAQIVAVDFAAAQASRFRLVDGNRHKVWSEFDANRAVLVSQSYAYRNRMRVGARLHLLTDRGYRSLPIAGIFLDYGSEQGIILIHRQLYERYFADRGVSSLGLYLRPGVHAAQVIDAVRAAAMHQQMIIAESSRAIRSASLKVFDDAFAITGVLKALAIVIAVVGILSALMALQLERSREFAVLRATGFTQGQVWGILTIQTGFMGICAGILALPAGIVLALLLIHVINRRAFGWSMQTVITPSVLAQALVLALVVALAAGLYPGWRMARTSPADALREE